MNINDQHALDTAYKGRGPFRTPLYVGVTNSPGRRLREHEARSPWMRDVSMIRLKRYRDRPSALEAEKRAIRAKRPRYNVQHNIRDREVDPAAVVAGLNGLGIAACLTVLGGRWLLDELSARWIRRRARQAGVAVELPPRRNPFVEPSVTLELLEVFMTVALTQSIGLVATVSPEGGMSITDLPSAAPVGGGLVTPFLRKPALQDQALALLLLYGIAAASQQSQPEPGE